MRAPDSTLEGCPWLTRGTAATVLGGDASLTVTLLNQSEGTCIFRGLKNPNEMLSIMVSGVVPKGCSNKSIGLAGVANWATECTISRSRDHYVASIRGQARDTYFTITLSLSNETEWRERETQLKNIAELVAGSLY